MEEMSNYVGTYAIQTYPAFGFKIVMEIRCNWLQNLESIQNFRIDFQFNMQAKRFDENIAILMNEDL